MTGNRGSLVTAHLSEWQGRVENKVLRGGAWNNETDNLRVANRNNNQPDNSNNNIGFRCALSAPGIFLVGQVRQIHGCGASAQGEYSRSGPGWAATVPNRR